MVRRRKQERSLFEVLLPDADKLWPAWLKRIDTLLEDEAVIDTVATALEQRWPQSRTRGREGTPAEVVLRMLILKHLHDWSFDELEQQVRANLVYRAFARIGVEAVPDAKTILKIAKVMGPEVITDLHQRVVDVAQRAGVTRGRRFRIDTTVVETNVHYPTDSTLLQDGVRVLTRAMRQAEAAVGPGAHPVRDRRRSVTRLGLAIRRQSRSPKTREAMVRSYRRVMAATRATLRDVRTTLRRTGQQLRTATGPAAAALRRARQIRDGLLSIEKADIADMLRIQLDDRAILMGRWRDLVLSVLEDSPSSPERGEFRRLVETTWTGHASVDSVAYRLVREFRLTAAELAWAPFVARVRPFDPGFPSRPGRTLEGPVWALLTTQPPHLLDPKYTDWSALMLDAIDQTIASLTSNNRILADRTWGEANTLAATHPLSRAVPQLRAWLDLPREPLPGDSHMPRFQSASNGASERFALSPGHESDGYFHMPGGQSGHPRSRNYTDGHQAWVTGEPTPFMPGQSVTRLVLRP